MDEIKQHDKQQGRSMAWHHKTDVKPDLSLSNCWNNGETWEYQVERIAGTPFAYLTVNDVNEWIDEETGEVYPRLYIGKPFSPGSFKPLMNKKFTQMLVKATEGKDLALESCGSVKNRGRTFYSFAMGESYRAAGRDFTPFFNVGNGNDKSSPIWQNTSNTCTVCNNTFQMNMLDNGLIMRVKKTKFSEEKTEIETGDFNQAARAMLAGQKEFAEMLEALGMIKCSEDTAREFFAGFIGEPDKGLSTRSENIVDRLVTLFKIGQGNNGKDFADVFSAGTDYYTHESTGGENNQWKQFVSSEFGSARNEKTRMWNMINVEKQREGLILIGREILKKTNKMEETVTV